MTAEIFPKTWVQCVDARGCDDILRLNGVYYVEAIEPCYDPETEQVVYDGAVLSGIEHLAFNPRRFKPLGGDKAQARRVERATAPA